MEVAGSRCPGGDVVGLWSSLALESVGSRVRVERKSDESYLYRV